MTAAVAAAIQDRPESPRSADHGDHRAAPTRGYHGRSRHAEYARRPVRADRARSRQVTEISMRPPLSTSLVAALACSGAVAAVPVDEERLSLTISGFRPSSATTVSASADDVLGEAIHLEETFHLARRHTRPRLDGMLRIGNRHRLVFNHYDLERSRSIRLEEEIEFDGQTFVIDTEVGGRFDFTLATLSYEYAVVETPALLVGAQIGAHWAEARVGIRSDGEPLAEAAVRAEGGSPALGLRVLGRPGQHWRFGGYLQAFQADIGDVDARFTRAGVFAEYRFTPHLGLQLGHDWFRLKADYTKRRWNGRLDLQIKGPTAGLTFAF